VSSEKNLTYRMFVQREYSFAHRPYNMEFEYYDLIVNGKLNEVKEQFTTLGDDGAGKLSDDPVMNIKFHFVITAALIARYCIANGMEMETAFNLSDYYINLADGCSDIASIEKVHYDAVCDYTQRMKELKKDNICSKPVVMALDYIYDNLHSKITVKDVAEHVSLSSTYLSRIFHAETGMPLSEYVMKCRVQAAENMLRYSEFTADEIANYLAFSSQSHFINVFKKHTGLTPREYRAKNYHTDVENLNAGIKP